MASINPVRKQGGGEEKLGFLRPLGKLAGAGLGAYYGGTEGAAMGYQLGGAAGDAGASLGPKTSPTVETPPLETSAMGRRMQQSTTDNPTVLKEGLLAYAQLPPEEKKQQPPDTASNLLQAYILSVKEQRNKGLA